MRPETSSPSVESPRPASVWVCLLLPALVGLLAITGRSFWIDECVTAQYVSQPTFSEWRSDLLTTPDAEAHTPLYLLYLWGWEKVFGYGEKSLRLAALPWFVIGVGLLLFALDRVLKGRWMAPAVLLSNAFVWYYLDEARLYTMQFGACCAVAGALIMLSRQSVTETGKPGWFRIFLFSTLILSGISIIGMLWTGAAAVVLAVVLPWPQIWQRIKSSPILATIWLGILVCLAGYYLSAVMRGARASGMATTNLETIIFVGYELLGFTGLGPGRDALRQQGADALFDYLPWLVLYAISVATVLCSGMVFVWKSRWRMRGIKVAVVVALPALFLLSTGVARHFRVLGRHCTPLLPLILILLVLGVTWLWRRGWMGRFAVVLYVALALISSVQVRLAPRHYQDDYRAAASFTRQAVASGERVWWAAAGQGAAYYGLPITQDSASEAGAYGIFGQSTQELAGLSSPDLVVLSRPDIYDYQGGLAETLKAGHYLVFTNFQGFEIWTHP